ncbi:MAG: BrnT family toxin [Roseiarcus sp.]
MEFEWDDAKSIRNQVSRGLSFGDAAMIFDGPVIATINDRHAYGETRVKALGKIKDEIYAVIYTDRQGVRRIISARRANKKERLQWQSFANP